LQEFIVRRGALLRRDLVLKVDIHLHADQERPGMGEFHQHVGDAEVDEIA
jgi:hypothetical protein